MDMHIYADTVGGGVGRGGGSMARQLPSRYLHCLHNFDS